MNFFKFMWNPNIKFFNKSKTLYTEKNSIAERTIFWSSEPENIAIRPVLLYGPQNYTSIGTVRSHGRES